MTADATMSKSQTLSGKLAIVTGASRGIGRSIALELASRGADILVHYSSSPDAAEEVASEVKALGRDAWTVKSDLSSKDCTKPIMAKVDELGREIHALVLNAGMCVLGSIEDLDANKIDELYTKQMDVNVRSVILLVNAAIARLARPSRIVLLSSVSARTGTPMQTVYGATKASLEHFARVWSKELGHSHGTTVNCLNPGPVKTDMWDANPPEVQAKFDFTKTPAEGRIGTGDDIAQIAAFLCEEGSRWISGSTVNSNGGLCPV